MKSSTPPSDRRHNRHSSEGSSFNDTGNNAANSAATAANTAASSSLPMTRLDHTTSTPPTHPNRLIPQPSPPSSSPTKNTVSPYQRSTSQDPSPSRPGSVASSPKSTISSQHSFNEKNLNNIHLTRISSPEHLSSLPPEFLTGDPHRPLLHVDEAGHEYRYFLNPMRKAVFFILLVEMLERFSFYGINYTTTAYLTGE